MVTVFSLARKRPDGSSRKRESESAEQSILDKAGTQSALQSFEEALKCVGFYGGKGGKLDQIMKVTEALFKRAGMFDYEAQMLKGISARIIQRASVNK